MRLCTLSRSSLFLGLVLPLLSFNGRAQHPTLHTSPDAGKVPAATAPDTKPAPSVPAALVSVRPVILPVVVRDKSGALVENLAKGDLSLEVDNHPQKVDSFAQDSTLPLTIGLLVDGSPSQRAMLDEERAAASAFLDGILLNPSDQAFMVEFAGKIELLQDLTSSKPKLQAALKDLEVASPPAQIDRSKPSDDEDEGSSRRSRTAAADTTLYDAVFLAADELMAKQTGRKVVILLTGGNDRNSKETLNNALESAQRSDTILYAIYLRGEEPRRLGNNRVDNGNYPNSGGGYPNNGCQGGGYPGGGYPGGGYPGGGYPGGGYPGGGYPGGGYPGGGCPGGGTNPNSIPAAPNVGRKTLERMTNETGGRMFEISRKQKMGDIFVEIGKELRAQYRLSYTPNGATASDGYHQVDLSLAGPDKKRLILQTRDGYYTGNK